MELTLDQALQKGIKAHKTGKAEEADRYYTAILKADPKHPDANHNMGVLAVGIGKTQEALPFFKKAIEADPNISQFWLSYIDALIKLEQLVKATEVFNEAQKIGLEEHNFHWVREKLINAKKTKELNTKDLPNEQLQKLMNLYNNGKLQAVLEDTKKLIKEYPNNLSLWNLMGIAASQTGLFDEAVFAFQKAINIKPDFANGYNNMGNSLKDQGKLAEAIEAYNIALAIKPDFAEAHNNMGNALKRQGKQKNAVKAYRKAISINPNYAEAYSNLGNTLADQGILSDAIEAYEKALQIKPDYAEAYSNMGTAYGDQGLLNEAIEAYEKALLIKTDCAETLYNMANALKNVAFLKPSSHLQQMIISILNCKTYARPKDIAPASLTLLRYEPEIKKLLKHNSNGKFTELKDKDTITFPTSPLLLKLMSVCPIADLEFEDLLSSLRSYILKNILTLPKTQDLINFQAALALQCFTNEYIYNQSEKDTVEIQVLEASIEKILSEQKKPNTPAILCLASYKSLREYEWHDQIDTTNELKDVFLRQVIEPKEEEKLKYRIPVLAGIDNTVSSQVGAQYEENPYPRWINLGLQLKPTSISQVFKENKLKLFNTRINKIKAPSILVAGCGTGQHSIGTATRFTDAKVLAIDLSLSSLAYAKRKSIELRIKNIEYMQADILDLERLDKSFDIIESVGVLHHMDDPIAGWKSLSKCLKSGGLMKIGLYSKSARQRIIQIRDQIAKTGIQSSVREMKSLRAKIINSSSKSYETIPFFNDFYSLSDYRDLLFHVKEHQFTIPEIKNCLNELELKFCGFEKNTMTLQPKVIEQYVDDPYNLDKWHDYEKIDPTTFISMYQFWCQKV